MRRCCKHSCLAYAGALAEHDPGYKRSFMTEDKGERAGEFARMLLAELSG